MLMNSQLMSYNSRDCAGTYDVYLDLLAELKELGMYDFYCSIIRPLTEGVFRMQMRGMPVSEGRLADAIKKKQEAMAGIRESIGDLGKLIGEPEYNPNSNPQTAKLLREFGFHSGRTTDKGALKADKMEIISALLKTANTPVQHIFQKIVDYRAESKDLGTFLNPIRPWPDGRVRTRFLATARTGRLQSRKWTTPWGQGPEFQNIPDDLRYIYCAPPGEVFVNADASQLELVIMANEAEVKPWQDAIAEGRSIHVTNLMNVMRFSYEQAMASKNGVGELHRPYYTIKKFAFADNYGAEVKTIQEQLLTEGRILMEMSELDRIMAAYRGFLPSIPVWRNRSYAQALATRLLVNRFGRMRRLFEPDEEVRGISFNHPIQSTGADFINVGFIKLDQQGLPLVNQVHDAVVAVCPKGEKEAVRERILEAFSHTIPINGREVSIRMDVKWGESWGELVNF